MISSNGMQSIPKVFNKRRRFVLFFDSQYLILQLSYEAAPEENLLTPSMRIAIRLEPENALALVLALLQEEKPVEHTRRILWSLEHRDDEKQPHLFQQDRTLFLKLSHLPPEGQLPSNEVKELFTVISNPKICWCILVTTMDSHYD